MDIRELYQIYLNHPKVSTDTRQIEQDSIFFALKGTSFNGNEFASAAIEKGASYAVVDDVSLKDKGPAFIYVEDSLKTLQALATHHRRQMKAPVIGITGTNGKTTTKELFNAVLSRKYNVLYTFGNLNNHIGVPLTLLRMNKTHEIAVIEMGANHLGDIDELCNIAEPDFGIITNIGRAHLEGFGSPQGIIKTKSELYRFIKAKGKKVFVNADNDLLMALSEGIDRVTYGKQSNVYVKGKLIAADPFVEIAWTAGDKEHSAKTQLIGAYNFENILAACTLGVYFEVGSEDIKAGLESYTPSNNRSQVIRTSTNTLIMDAYNANPTSMDAAIRSFSEMNHPNKWLVLGDMLELGSDSAKEHQQLVDAIRSRSYKNVVLVGPEFSKTDHQGFTNFTTTEEARNFLKEKKITEGLILLKGSRGIKLEALSDVF